MGLSLELSIHISGLDIFGMVHLSIEPPNQMGAKHRDLRENRSSSINVAASITKNQTTQIDAATLTLELY